MEESIKVLVRIRPLVDTEKNRDAKEVVGASPDKPEVVFSGSEARHQLRCQFDHVLGQNSTQGDVYEHVQDCAEQVASGYNSTILAYGQTGSGKTHTMFGPENWDPKGADSGIVPRAVDSLFRLLQSPATVYASFVQIYREQIFDMLRDPTRSAPLGVRQENEDEHFVDGLSEYAVRNASDCLRLLKAGEANRAVRETHMNAASSRSHSIFTVLVEQKKVNGESEITLRSKFNLVDLAGSEKWDVFQNMVEDRVAEMTDINKSLHTLGKCIAALSKASKQKRRSDGSLPQDVHVPYRESKLTRLLQDSLGGNSITRLIATLSPAADCILESVSTLRFADRARSVVSSVRRNEERPIDHALVKKLQKEVARLRAILKTLSGGDGDEDAKIDVGKLVTELETLRAENERLRGGINGQPSSQKQQQQLVTLPDIVPRPAEKRKIPVSSDRQQLVDKRTNVPLDFEPLDLISQYKLVRRNALLEAAIAEVRKSSSNFFAFEIEEDELRSGLQEALKNLEHDGDDEVLALSSCPDEALPAPPDENSSSSSSLLKAPVLPPPTEESSAGEVASKPPKQAPTKTSMLASSISGPKYRVRQGRRNSRVCEDWIDPEIEREEALKRELRETKARMKKHAEMRDWLIRKNAEEEEMLRKEEEEREAMRAIEIEKEKKFRRRAEKQKRKLESYYRETLQQQPTEAPSSPIRDDEADEAFGRKLEQVLTRESRSAAEMRSPPLSPSQQRPASSHNPESPHDVPRDIRFF